jgi:hypothetical protein
MPADPSLTIKKGNGWNPGPLKHIVPTANHERFLIKISLQAPVKEAPQLRVDDKRVRRFAHRCGGALLPVRRYRSSARDHL